jgi:hypothetical protein
VFAGKLIVPQGKCPFPLRSNKFPRGNAHVSQGATSSPGKMNAFLGKHVQFPRELVIPLGTCYSLRNKCNSLGELFFPWETRAILWERVVPCEKYAFSLGNLLFLGKKKIEKKKKRFLFFS